MEDRPRFDFDGVPLLPAHLNTLGETTAFADDRTYAELFKLTPTDGATVYKRLIPTRKPFVKSSGAADGKLTVAPFRALVGSRDSEATDARLNWRDIRTVMSMTDSDTTASHEFTIAPASAGDHTSNHSRWDLIYATVTLEIDSSPVTRKVKHLEDISIPTSPMVVTDMSVILYTDCSLTLTKISGTPAFTPVKPTIPADTATTFVVPITYVFVHYDDTAGFTLSPENIYTVAETATLNRSTGGVSTRLATGHIPVLAPPGGGGPTVHGYRELSSTCAGSETLWVVVDASANDTALWSHEATDTIDSSDWRNRMVHSIVQLDFPDNIDPDLVCPFPAWSQTSHEDTAPSIRESLGETYTVDGIYSHNRPQVAHTLADNDLFPGDFPAPVVLNSPVFSGFTVFYLDPTTGALKIWLNSTNRFVGVYKIDWSPVLENTK